MGKGKNLKAALQSQQSRLKAKQKILHAAHVTEQRAKKSGHKSQKNTVSTDGPVKGKGKAIAQSPRRITVPFRPTDKILLIGEGDFSFTRALVQNPPPQLETLPPTNITATAYDTESSCYEKYQGAKEIVESLREKGVEIIFEVDGTRLEKVPKLKGRRWDRIIWNFPHAGKGITDQDRNILSNQMLILGFLRSAANVLALGPVPSFTNSTKKKRNMEDEDDDIEISPAEEVDDVSEEDVPTRGTILITLRNVPPYTLWDVPRLAKKPPPPTSGSTPPNPKFTLLRSFTFHRNFWSGYEHKMTKGERAHGTGTTGEGGEDRTWEFCLRDAETGSNDRHKSYLPTRHRPS